MNKAKLAVVGVTVAVFLVVMSFPLSSSLAGSGHDKQGKMDHSKMDMKKGSSSVLSLAEIQSVKLPLLSRSIESALKAISAGKSASALAELREAQELLVAISKSLSKYAKPVFANVRCPVMGSPIKPEKVPPALTRDYKGRKVAFCCGRCPSAWDKLSDAQKQARLESAEGKTKESSHSH